MLYDCILGVGGSAYKWAFVFVPDKHRRIFDKCFYFFIFYSCAFAIWQQHFVGDNATDRQTDGKQVVLRQL